MYSLLRIAPVVAACSIAAVCVIAAPVWAWGPTAQTSIVTTAVHVLSQDRSMPLVNLRQYVRDGANVSEEKLREIYPDYEIDEIAAIQQEMFLLQSVRSGSIDPYFAYRLGTLGKIVAKVTAPLASGNPTYRDMYYNDVESAIGRAEMHSNQRLLVDPATYFLRIRREAGAQDTTIEVDYRTGLAFGGFAQGALSNDASRSVNAVADVWYTILSADVTAVNIARSNQRHYFLRGLDFYLDINRRSYATDAIARLRELNLLDSDTLKAAGDLYFDAGYAAEAMTQYTAALALDPGRRDVMRKVAQYYVQVGDDALAESKLEAARDAYIAALNADKLHPDAQRKLLEAEDRIEERDARLAQARDALAKAADALSQAEAAALSQNFAEAISKLSAAQDAYSKVTNEFPEESETASQGLRSVGQLMRDFKSDLMTNAQNLSGAGAPFEAQRLAEKTSDISEQALRSMLEREYRASLQVLREQLQDSLRSAP